MELERRRQKIIDLINSQGSVWVEDLAKLFDVTTQTIRLDLNDLSDRGILKRTHGGAIRLKIITNHDYISRRKLYQDEKKAIGVRAALLIPNDCSVSLNIGTTTEQVARSLISHSGLTVITNNTNIINLLAGTTNKDLILAGGHVRQEDGAVVGGEAVEFISRYKVDFAVIGASGLDSDGSILDFDQREVAVARAILHNSRTRILVSDCSKFKINAPVRICGLAELDYFITDGIPPQEFLDVATKVRTEIISLQDNSMESHHVI